MSVPGTGVGVGEALVGHTEVADVVNDHRSEVAPGVAFTATVPPTTRMVVDRAVLAQGGTIGVETEPGAGSVFWFELPRTVVAR